jgi:hypothetical protein
VTLEGCRVREGCVIYGVWVSQKACVSIVGVSIVRLERYSIPHIVTAFWLQGLEADGRDFGTLEHVAHWLCQSVS